MGPHPNDLHRAISQVDPMRLIGSHEYTTNATPVPQMVQ